MLRNLNLILFLFAGLCLRMQAQQDAPEKFLEVRGISELEMEPLSRATATLYEGAAKVKSIQTGSDGSFSFKLDINKQYTIEVGKDGLISKRIVFNTQMPEEEKGTWMNEFSIGLVKPCSGIDYSVLKEPVDRVTFDAKRREFLSDKDYVNNMRPRIEALMIKTDQCMLETYETLVKKADQAARQNNFEDAISAYKEAQVIYPREDYPSKRISELNATINKQQNSAAEYKDLVAEADALTAQGKYTEALQKYNKASALNPQDSYPKQKAAEIVEKQSLEERFNQAMAKASVAYTRKDYLAAKEYYREALEIKPAESLPKTRVQEIDAIQAKKASEDAARAAETAKKTAADKEYQGLVTQADELFKAKKYEEAKATYAKAQTMKPAESYPAQRVKVIENAMALEEAAVVKSKEDGYNNAMAVANNALAKNQFQMAKDSYQKALSLKPDDLQARNRLAEVDRLAEEFSRQKSQEDKYKTLIQSADALLSQKEWMQAKETYSQALALKPGDKYAQTRITAIDNTVAAEQASLQKARTDSYNSAMSAGNNALAKYQFDVAKEAFQKALAIKPGDPLTKERIAETERLADESVRKMALENQYKKIIQDGDALLATKEVARARESYSQALSLKPGDPYAQARITAIDNAIAAEQAAKMKATEEGYKAAVGAANTAIAQKSYSQAKEFLQKALSIKPGDAYATGKSAEVERLIGEQQKKMEQEQQMARQYSEIIASADRLFNDHDYLNAKTSYAKALQLKPGDAYASQKMMSIENIMAAEMADKQKKAEDAYSGAMIRGSNALLAKDYLSAKTTFQEALAVRPGDNNARQKIAEADLLIKQEQEKLATEQARKKKYDESISGADQYFAQKNFTGARTLYEQALAIMPSETYPRQKLDEIMKAIEQEERLMADQKARDNAFNMALVNADKYFKAKDYSQAKDEYNRALVLKPEETIPKTRIAEIEKLITAQQKEQAEAKARTNAYTTAINSGNEAFSKKEYTLARTSYTEALKFMPGDILASDQIKKIDYLITETEKVRKNEQARKEAYEALILSADNAFDAARYTEAKDAYKKALTMEPANAYVKQRIARIDEINRLLSKSPARSNVQTAETARKTVAAIPMGELNFKNESERQIYLDQLKTKYPAGITLEKYKEKYKEIYRYIIIRNNEAQEFRHVQYNTYSGAQYSVNGKPITQQYFLSQTRTREGETYKEIDM